MYKKFLPQLCLFELENGCHPSQWQITAKLRGSPLGYIGEWLNALKR